MKMRYAIRIIVGLGCSAWGFLYRPFPMSGDDPMLDLGLYHTPNFYSWIIWWYYFARPPQSSSAGCSDLRLAGLV